MFLKTVKDWDMKFSGIVDLSIVVCYRGRSISAVTSGRDRKWKKKSKISKLIIQIKTYTKFIRCVFKCHKQLTPPEVEASTSGYSKKKYQILNFQCLQSSLLLKCFTWN
jgi:hypothetical protein